MRRIYESSALRRDDDEPFAPREDDESAEPRAMRTVSGAALSRLLVPRSIELRAISLSVATPASEYPEGSRVPFTVTMRNALPIPITLRTNSPIRWTWSVDGVEEASHVSLQDPPNETQRFTFDRGETKRFRRTWSQSFRVSETEWEPAGPGEYTITAGVNVDDPAANGLAGETRVRIVPD